MKPCAFCGNEIDIKSKEHILPMWLLKMTGDPKRKFNLGLNFNKLLKGADCHMMEFSANSFTVPSCHKCNERYGRVLEPAARAIMVKIMGFNPLSEDEINTLLDWFDKVRVGLWIAYSNLNKDYSGVGEIRKFHIDQRVGVYDRALIVYHAKSGQGLNFFGANNVIFDSSPTCFALRVNDFYFINISANDILLKDCGLPFPINKVIAESGRVGFEGFDSGTQEIGNPLQSLRLNDSSIIICQPVFAELTSVDEFCSDYVKSISYDSAKGYGPIYVKVGDSFKNIKTIKEYSLNPIEEYPSSRILSKRVILKVHKVQKKLIEEILDSAFTSNEVEESAKAYYGGALKIQDKMIKDIANMDSK